MLNTAFKKGLVCASWIFVLDQLTKLWAEWALPFRIEKPVTSFFNFYLAHNPGIAFSLFAHMGDTERYVLLAFTALVALCILWILRQLEPQESLTIYAMGLILGGGLANAWDRFDHGFVTDFLDFHLKSWHWPTFNVADIAISFGVILVLWSCFETKKTKSLSF